MGLKTNMKKESQPVVYFPLGYQLDWYIEQILKQELEYRDGNKAAVARSLGMTRTTVKNWVQSRKGLAQFIVSVKRKVRRKTPNYSNL